MAQVRVGVIGTGFGLSVVAPAFAAAEDCEVVEVVSPRNDDGVTALCRRSDVELISVHSPPFLHVQHVRQAIETGHAVHCDKPFGITVDEAVEMTELAGDAGVLNFLNFERRFDPEREHLRQLLAEGVVGEPRHFQYSRYLATQGLPWSWLCNKELGGGWLAGQGSHLIDLCRWLFGEVTDAAAMMRTTESQRPDKEGDLQLCDAEDAFVASLRTANGVTAVIDCALWSPVNMPEHTAVWGTTGVLEVGDTGVVRRGANGEVETYETEMKGKSALVVSMERWAANVCQAVRTGEVEPDWPTFEDGLACAQVMDRMGRTTYTP